MENFEKKFVADSEGNIKSIDMTLEEKMKTEKLIQKQREREREKQKKEFAKYAAERKEQEAKLTPEQKAERQAKWEEENRRLEKGDREWLANFFQEEIDQKGKYSETLIIEPNGELNKNKRIGDNAPPFFIILLNKKTIEDFYQFCHKVQQEHPELSFSFETDPERIKWIKYTVKKAEKSNK